MAIYLIMMRRYDRISSSMNDFIMHGHNCPLISHDTPCTLPTRQIRVGCHLLSARRKRPRVLVINPPTLLLSRCDCSRTVIQYSMTAVPLLVQRFHTSCLTLSAVAPAKYNHLRNCVKWSRREREKNVERKKNEIKTKNCVSDLSLV